MFTTMKVSEFLSLTGQTLKGVGKIVLQSRPLSVPQPVTGGTVVVLANGPSLRGTIEQYGQKLKAMPTVAVNFMANAPEFVMLQPRYYVLADPHFFVGLDQENVESLWRNLSRVEWDLTLYVPRTRLNAARKLLGKSCVKLVPYNFVGVEGFAWFERMAYSSGLGMPRPRNVLIPALMAALSAGYTKIYITGADHSWMETIRVTDDNRVVSVQPHFYTDSQAEQTRSATEYRGYRLHQILDSFRIAFESYHHLQRYAAYHHIEILNATPGSYIDAFARSSL